MKVVVLGLAASLAAGGVAFGQDSGAPGGAAERCKAETDAGRFTEARVACDQAVAAQPTDPAVLGLRAQLAVRQGQLDAAIRDLDAAIDINPRADNLLYQRALVYQRKGNAAAAQLDFQTALLGSPKNVDYLIGAGNLSLAQKQYDKALELLNRALTVNPASTPALMSKGHALRYKGDNAGALVAFDAAVKAAPGDAQPLHWRGHAHGLLNDQVKAEADFAAALAISPRSADILTDRADALTLLKRPAEAMESYNRAVAADPSYVRAVRTRGVARYRAGDLLGSLLDLEQAQKVAPDQKTANNLAVVDQGLAEHYAGPLMQARAKLRRADNEGASCEGELPDRSSYGSALRGAEGDIARADAALGASALDDYRACLRDAREVSASETEEDLPELRRAMADLLDKQATATAKLRADCAAQPAAKTVCDDLLADITAETVQLRTDHKRIEAAALAQGGNLAQLEAAAPTRVAEAVNLARKQFAAEAGKEYGGRINLANLQQASSLAGAGSVQTMHGACGSFQLRVPRPGESDTMNAQLDSHRACLTALKRQGASSGSDWYSAQYRLDDAIRVNATYRQFRCSVRPEAGCVDDAAWNRVAALATPALRDRALANSRMVGGLSDQVDAELVRLNDAVKRINVEIDRHNAEIDRQNSRQQMYNALSAFADAFNAASANNNYGYGTSTVLPGIR